MAYELRGTYTESCNCDVACPCGASNLVLPATNDRCLFLMAFHMDEGQVDGVDVAGTTTAMFADTPAQMTDGGWRVGVFLDASATEEQRDKLAAGEPIRCECCLRPFVGGAAPLPLAVASDPRPLRRAVAARAPESSPPPTRPRRTAHSSTPRVNRLIRRIRPVRSPGGVCPQEGFSVRESTAGLRRQISPV